MSEYSQQKRERFLSQGLCATGCGRALASTTLCVVCRKKKMDVYRAHVQSGRCRHGCDAPSFKAAQCEPCYSKYLLFLREKRKSRIENRICTKCGVSAIEKCTYCLACYYKARNKYYGLPPGTYEKMRSENAGCQACGRLFVDEPYLESEVIDHDHGTGMIRGLLCVGCNMALGFLRDDAECIRKLALYIEKYGVHDRSKATVNSHTAAYKRDRRSPAPEHKNSSCIAASLPV